MINTPKELSDIEVGLYKSGYGFCEKLVKEEHMTIAAAVEKTAAKFAGLNMISDMECFKTFLFSEVTAYTEPSIGVCDPNLEDKTWWDELKQDPKFKPEYWSRYYDYLLRKPSWSITAVEDIKSDKFLIDMSSITDIVMFSISVDNINTFASHAEKLSFIKTKCGAICIAIDDLMVYQDYFDSPLKFIHFLKQRMKASLLPALVTTDELDHLGMYIEHNCYSMCFEGSDASRINPVGYRKDLDVFYGQRFHPELHPEKPSQNLPPLFEEIISLLERNESKDRIAFSDYLLNFSSEAKEQFAEEVLHTYEDQKKTHRSKIITTAGRNENDLRYSCFIFQPDVPAISNSEQEEYIWSNMLWNEEKNRIKINITFDDRRRIIDIGYSCFDEKSIPLDRRDILLEQGKTRAAERIQKYRNVNGNKIGRNKLCPCGSGKKYKKCCGRNF